MITGIVCFGEVGKVEHDFIPVKQLAQREDVRIWTSDSHNWLVSSIKNRIGECPKNCDFFISGYDGSQSEFRKLINCKTSIAFDPVDFAELIPKPKDYYDTLFKLQINSYTRKIQNRVFTYQYPISDNMRIECKNIERDIDINFIGGLWPPSLDIEHPRYRAVKMLKNHFGSRFFGGITTEGVGDDVYFKPISQSEFLSTLNRSKIVINISNKIDLKNGRHCRRQTEGMMMGCSVVSHEMDSEWFENPNKIISYYKHDLSDIIDVCENLLSNNEKLKEISKNSVDFFNKEYDCQGEFLHSKIIEVL